MAMGAWCHTVLTAVTAQTPLEVRDIYALPASSVSAQLAALFSLDQEFSPQVLKTGMLGSSEIALALTAFLAEQSCPLVLDTVFKASSGGNLAEASLPAVILEYLAPMATLITPNLPEAAILLGCEEAQNEKQMHRQVEALMQLNLSAVLLKGGHLPGDEVVDILATRAGIEVFRSKKIATTHTHGSGCALATAVAVGLAKNQDLATAVGDARTQVRTYIQNASKHHFVKTNGPLVHFNLQEKE